MLFIPQTSVHTYISQWYTIIHILIHFNTCTQVHSSRNIYMYPYTLYTVFICIHYCIYCSNIPCRKYKKMLTVYCKRRARIPNLGLWEVCKYHPKKYCLFFLVKELKYITIVARFCYHQKLQNGYHCSMIKSGLSHAKNTGLFKIIKPSRVLKKSDCFVALKISSPWKLRCLSFCCCELS